MLRTGGLRAIGLRPFRRRTAGSSALIARAGVFLVVYLARDRLDPGPLGEVVSGMNDDRVALLESSDDFDGGSEITPQLHFVIVYFVLGIDYADLGRSGLGEERPEPLEGGSLRSWT